MNPSAGQDPTLKDLLRVLERRKQIFFATILLCVTGAAVIAVLTTRRYDALAIIQLQKSTSDSLNLDSLLGSAGGGAGDALSANIDLQTQSSILQSDTLALKVIRDLHLAENRDFKTHFSLIGWILSPISPSGPLDNPNAALEDAPRLRTRLTGIFASNLRVRVVAGTRLIQISYSNPDPKVAAAVVNHLVQGLIDYTFQTKFTATNEVSGWLEGQLTDLRKQSENLQSQVVTLQRETGLYGLSGSDTQGRPMVYSPVLNDLQMATSAHSEAEMSRVLKGAVYGVVKTGDPEAISQLSGTTLGIGASQGVVSSLALIQSLRQQEATIRQQVAQDSTRFGSAYPKLIDERASLKQVTDSLNAEIARIRERAKNDYDVAERVEQEQAKKQRETQATAAKLNDNTIQYNILQREATQSQDLYQDLLKRLKEAGILEGLRSSNITVVDPARAPWRPSTPNFRLLLGLGLGAGIFLGLSLAFVTDAIDAKIVGAEELEAGGYPLLGILPDVQDEDLSKQMVFFSKSKSVFSEAIRTLRSAVLISKSGSPPQVILISSANPGEGKSVISLNLASALASTGRSVLLVEADMRRPVFRKRVGLDIPDTNYGLSVLLASQTTDFKVFKIGPPETNFSMIPAGAPPPFPAELIGSVRMEQLIAGWRKQYDFIVIDSPPVLPVTDTQLLVSQADSTLMVTRARVTTRAALQRAYKLLSSHRGDGGSAPIGIVLNAISATSAAYYGYYGYYGNKTAYGSEGNKDA